MRRRARRAPRRPAARCRAARRRASRARAPRARRRAQQRVGGIADQDQRLDLQARLDPARAAATIAGAQDARRVGLAPCGRAKERGERRTARRRRGRGSAAARSGPAAARRPRAASAAPARSARRESGVGRRPTAIESPSALAVAARDDGDGARRAVQHALGRPAQPHPPVGRVVGGAEHGQDRPLGGDQPLQPGRGGGGKLHAQRRRTRRRVRVGLRAVSPPEERIAHQPHTRVEQRRDGASERDRGPVLESQATSTVGRIDRRPYARSGMNAPSSTRDERAITPNGRGGLTLARASVRRIDDVGRRSGR